MVAELMGTKTFLNEFVAYTALSKLIANGVIFNEYVTIGNGTWSRINEFDILLTGTNTTLVGGILQVSLVYITFLPL